MSSDYGYLIGFGIFALVFVAYEMAGLSLPGLHTISYLAHNYTPLRIVILLFFGLVPIWWWWHSGNVIPR